MDSAVSVTSVARLKLGVMMETTLFTVSCLGVGLVFYKGREAFKPKYFVCATFETCLTECSRCTCICARSVQTSDSFQAETV